eukprot:242539-Pelagomonas_calceolata.AAC.1
MGIWRVTGSTRIQNLAVRSITVFNSTIPQICALSSSIFLDLHPPTVHHTSKRLENQDDVAS